jgi:hypothetical protein
MRALLSTSVAALFLVLASSDGIADEWEVNNIWWTLIYNYNNSGEDVCIAENYYSTPRTAVFSVFPGDVSIPMRPVHGIARVMLPSYTPVKFFGWVHGTIGNLIESCTLQSWY